MQGGPYILFSSFELDLWMKETFRVFCLFAFCRLGSLACLSRSPLVKNCNFMCKMQRDLHSALANKRSRCSPLLFALQFISLACFEVCVNSSCAPICMRILTFDPSTCPAGFNLEILFHDFSLSLCLFSVPLSSHE